MTNLCNLQLTRTLQPSYSYRCCRECKQSTLPPWKTSLLGRLRKAALEKQKKIQQGKVLKYQLSERPDTSAIAERSRSHGDC